MNHNTLLHLTCDVKPELSTEEFDKDDDKSTRAAVQPPTTEETADYDDVASSLEVLGMLVELAPELPQKRNTLEILPIHLACQAHATECVQLSRRNPITRGLHLASRTATIQTPAT